MRQQVRRPTSPCQIAVWLNKEELWFQHQKYNKAAPLFAEAGLFDRAARCYHFGEKYDTSAAMLRQGNHFDLLVSYLSEYVAPILGLLKCIL